VSEKVSIRIRLSRSDASALRREAEARRVTVAAFVKMAVYAYWHFPAADDEAVHKEIVRDR
jgi:hypothetical protein